MDLSPPEALSVRDNFDLGTTSITRLEKKVLGSDDRGNVSQSDQDLQLLQVSLQSLRPGYPPIHYSQPTPAELGVEVLPFSATEGML